jgi:hypothetical protein
MGKLSENEFLYYNSIYRSTDARFIIKVENSDVFAILNNRLEKIDQSNLSNKFILTQDNLEMFEDTLESL